MPLVRLKEDAGTHRQQNPAGAASTELGKLIKPGQKFMATDLEFEKFRHKFELLEPVSEDAKKKAVKREEK
jgi:hypothetical protein